MRRLIPVAVGAAVALGVLASSLYVVDQHRYAALYAFGELREVVAEPGLRAKLPAPLQNVVYLDKRMQTLDAAGERFVSAEQQDLLAGAFVKWRIADPRRYLGAIKGASFQGGAERGAELIGRALQAALSAEIGTRTLAEVVSGRAQLDAALRARLGASGREIGVEIVDARVKRVDFDAKAANAVLERMKAERIRVAGELRSSGQAEADEIRADAERQRSVLVAESRREVETIKGEGEARASRIYAQSFGKNPEFYRFYRSLEAYRASFNSRSDVLVLDANSEFFKYFRGPGGGK